MKSLILCILMSVLVLFSCSEENEQLHVVDLSKQQILFEYYRINYAWGLSYNHWIIDNNGNIRINKKADSLIWIDQTRLNDYKNQFDSVIYEIDKAQLDKYIELIPSASTGQVFTEDGNKADFGSTGYNCFFYDGNQFKTIVLSEASDLIDKKNLSPSAIKINQWLWSLNKEVYSD